MCNYSFHSHGDVDHFKETSKNDISMVFGFTKKKNKTIDAYPSKKKFCMTTNVQSTNRYFLTKGVLWKDGFFGNILVSLFLLSFLS